MFGFTAGGTDKNQKKEQDFLAAMYQRYYQLARSYALKIVEDEKIAEDMIQEAFIRLIPEAEKLMQMKEPVYVSYLITTVKRVSSDYVRRNANKRFKDSLSFSEVEYLNLPDDLPDVAEFVADNISAEKMKRAVQKLPDKYRDVLLFEYLLEMSDSEIGKMLDISAGSVRQYLTRAQNGASKLREGKTRMMEMEFKNKMSENKGNMTDKSDESKWNELFHAAVILAAEEDGNELFTEYEGVCDSPPPEERRAQYERKVGEYYGGRGSVKKSALKRRLVIAASCAAVVFLLCLPFSFKVLENMEDGQAEQNEEKTDFGVFDHVFVYADDRKYDLLKGKNIVLPDMNIQWGMEMS